MYPEPIIILFTIFAGLFGAVIGSFLNVCIHRLPRGYLSISYPGSHCTQCGTFLKWYDNIPILSWCMLGGACRSCRNIISFRYVLVEMVTSLLFILYTRLIVLTPMAHFGSLLPTERWFVLLVALYMIAIMIIITFIDISYRIIPDSITYSGIMIAPFISAICPVLHPHTVMIAEPHLAGLVLSLLGILVGGGSLYIVGIIGKMIFRKDAMGFGDVKMMALVGGFLGWDSALIIFLLACLIGTVLGLISMLITKDRYTAFGPYLAAATLLTILFKKQILYIAFTAWPNFVASWMNS